MSKLRHMLSAVMAGALPLLLAGTVFAASQIEGGNIYKVQNVTQNTIFTDPINAKCGEVVQFRVHMHNIGPDPSVNTRVQATLPTGNVDHFASTVTVRSDNTQPVSVSDTATVNLSEKAAVSYVNGSTQLLDLNKSLVSNLPDGVTQGGVVLPSNIGVSVEQSRFVQFRARISCPTPPVTPPTPTAVKGVTTLPNTGPGEVLGIFAGASAAGAAGHYAFRRYRRDN